jgi:hypothetical protein
MKRDVFELIDRQEHIEQATRAMKAMSHPLRPKTLRVIGSGEFRA